MAEIRVRDHRMSDVMRPLSPTIRFRDIPLIAGTVFAQVVQSRAQLRVPVSPTPNPMAETLFEPPEEDDPKRYFLPRFLLAEQTLDGRSQYRVLLRRIDATTSSLSIVLKRESRPGGTDPLAIETAAVLRFVGGSVRIEIPLTVTAAGDEWTVAKSITSNNELDQMFRALTDPDYQTELVIRCAFTAAMPVPGSGHWERPRAGTRSLIVNPDDLVWVESYQVARKEVVVSVDRNPFVFDRDRDAYVFQGIDNVSDNTFGVIPRTVAWRGREHHYLQDETFLDRFYCLPDAYKVVRNAQAPYMPAMVVRFSSPDGSLGSMRASLEYQAAPVVDVERLEAAVTALARHLPSPLPAGMTGPVLQPLQVASVSQLTLKLNLPRAGTSAGQLHARPDVVTNLSEPFNDRIADLPMESFQDVYDALFGGSAVLFTGGVHVTGADRPEVVVPFSARLNDLYGPLFDIATATKEDGTVEATLRNAIESPVLIRSLPVVGREADVVTPGRVEGLTLQDQPVQLPVLVPAGEALSVKVAWEAIPVTVPDRPTLRRGDHNVMVEELQRALTAAGHPADVDGRFGPQTEGAVKALQQAWGLDVTGVVDAGTWAALESGAGSSAGGAQPVGLVPIFDLKDVKVEPDPEAIWNAILDDSVPAEYARVIKVVGVREWFEPPISISAIAIAFVNGGSVVLRAGELEGEAQVRLPVSDLVLRKVQESSYRYTQTTVRGGGQVRREKTDNVGLLVPELDEADS